MSQWPTGAGGEPPEHWSRRALKYFGLIGNSDPAVEPLLARRRGKPPSAPPAEDTLLTAIEANTRALDRLTERIDALEADRRRDPVE